MVGTRELAVGVVLRHPDTGAPVFLPAGSAPPDWALLELGEHVFAAPDAEASTVGVPADAEAPPPQAGPGSARGKWAAYAAAHSVTVTDTMGREDIVAACKAADVRVE